MTRYRLVACSDGPLSDADIKIAVLGLDQYCVGYPPSERTAAALEAALKGAGDAWQTIESAPRDGTVVDLWHKVGIRMCEVWWANGCWSNCFDDCDFTHWMSVPADPSSAKGEV